MSYDYTDEEGCSWESIEDWFLIDQFGLCGCYDETIVLEIRTLLKELYNAHKADKSFYYTDPKAQDRNLFFDAFRELILHRFDRKGWTEHGIGVRGCWLTDKGVEMYEKIYGEKK